MRDSLTREKIWAELPTRWVGNEYQFFPVIDSTNRFLKESLANEGSTRLPHGSVMVTDFQAQGRGRMARRWLAPAGSSVLMSLLLRPNWPVERGMWLTMMAGLAVVDAISAETGIQPALKWPNDVVVAQDGTWRKLCGILVEAELDAQQRIASGIVGIGINVNISAEMLPEAATPATSLQVVCGRPIARRPLLLALLQAFERRYDAAERGQSPHAEWAARLMTIGQPVRVSAVGGQLMVEGTAVGVSAEGQLLVEQADGRVEAVSVGDVTLREVDFSEG